MFPSVIDTVGSKKVSDKHALSKLWIFINASANGTLTKSWTASPFKFEWQNLIKAKFLDPDLVLC